MNYYIADCHFGDEAVIGYSHRPFASVQEMDETMIHRWNRRVREWDDVYIVGDFVHRSVDPSPYLDRLQGRLHLICGNHDREYVKNPSICERFHEIMDYKILFDHRHRIALFHYPVLEWDGYYYGTWHIFGHIHNHPSRTQERARTLTKALNCGVDVIGFQPVDFDELVRINRKDGDRLTRPEGAV